LAVLTKLIDINILRGETKEPVTEREIWRKQNSQRKSATYFISGPNTSKGLWLMTLDSSRTGFEGCYQSWCGQFPAFVSTSLVISIFPNGGSFLRAAFHREEFGSIPSHLMWDIWWTKWHWDRYASEPSSFRRQNDNSIAPYSSLSHVLMSENHSFHSVG
jgi:hypothetical protein